MSIFDKLSTAFPNNPLFSITNKITDDWYSNNTFLDSNYLQGLGFNYDDATDTDLGWIDQNGMRFGTSLDDDNNLLENFNYTLGDNGGGGVWVGNDVWDQWKGTYDPTGNAVDIVGDITNQQLDFITNGIPNSNGEIVPFPLFNVPEGGFTPEQVIDALGNTADPDPNADPEETTPDDPTFDPLDHNEDGVVNYLDFMGNAPIWGQGEFNFTGTAPGAFEFTDDDLYKDPIYLQALRDQEQALERMMANQGLTGSGAHIRQGIGNMGQWQKDWYDSEFDKSKIEYDTGVDTYLRDWGQMYTDYSTINDQYWKNIEAATGIQGLGAEAAGQAGDIMFESADSFVDVIAAMTGIQIDNAQTLGEIDAALATGDVQAAFQIASLAIDAVGATKKT